MPATGEAEARDGEDAVDRVLLVVEEVVAHVVEHRLGTADRRARRGGDEHEEDALVFLRQEGARHAQEEKGHAHDDDGVDDKVNKAAAEDVTDTSLVMAIGRVEAAIEEAEDAA